jgi:hypothetical protein
VTEEARQPWSLRRRIASALLLVGILFLGNHFCASQGKIVTVEIAYHLGSPPIARRIDVALVPRGATEPVVTFWRDPALPVTTHHPRLAPGMYVAEITLTRADGTTRRVTRPIEAMGDASITIDLEGES